MPHGRVSAHIYSPTVGVIIDMGHPLLNRMVDGFLKVGTVGASRVAAEETYDVLRKDLDRKVCPLEVQFCPYNNEEILRSVTKHDFEHSFKKMGKEGLQWGVVAGVYTGMEYGVERVRGRHDWKNALIGGALTGAFLSFGESHNSRDKMIRGAITGGAIATAVEFIRYLT